MNEIKSGEQFARDFTELNKYKSIGTPDELEKRVAEDDVIKFYYCESQDEYWIGKRIGTLYYAMFDWKTSTFIWKYSRYLPWGESVNGYTYPSEPREVDISEFVRSIVWGTMDRIKQMVI